MSLNVSKLVGVVIFGVAGVAGWLLLNWSSEPRPLSADPPPNGPPTTVSVVFVLDSSPNMFPWDGYDYFQLAKDGILQILRNEDLTDDGRYEFGLVQYCQPESPGYVQGSQSPGSIQRGTVHWFAPTWISDDDARTQAIAWVEDLEPCTHFTRGLFDMGIKSAATAIANSSADQKHILYIGTGEYRLPLPCPMAAYDTKDNTGQSVCSYANEVYGLHTDGNGCKGGRCNRVCDVRHHSELAHASQVSFSAVQVGPKFNQSDVCGREEPEPYGKPPDYCNGVQPDAEYHPNRDGLLQELVQRDASTGEPCQGYGGLYARVAPAISFGLEGIVSQTQVSVEQRITDEIAESIRQALCQWADDDDQDGDGFANLCDNCPHVSNPRQRDCDEDGIGDLCHTEEECGNQPGDMDDDDLDGLCNGLDTCPGGDDCLIRYWIEKDSLYVCVPPAEGEPVDLSTCGCDRDDNNAPDLCQMAQVHRPDTLPPENTPSDPNDPDFATSFDDSDPVARDGIPDCAQLAPITCHPFPEQADLTLNRANNQCVPGGSSTLSAEFTSAFCEFQSSADTAADFLLSRGWYVDGLQGALALNASAVYPPDDSGDESFGLGILTLNAALAQPGSQLKSPILALPDASSCERCSGGDIESWRRCPMFEPWPYTVVQLDLSVSNANDQRWHIVVLDPCAEGRERAHVVLSKMEGNATRVLVKQNCDSPTQCVELDQTITYKQNQYFRLHFAFNRTAPYELTEEYTACRQVNNDGSRVAIGVHRLGTASAHPSTQIEPGFYESARVGPTYYEPAGRGGSYQLAVYPENYGGTAPSLQIGRVRFYNGSPCQYWTELDDFSVCAACGCENDATWNCVDADFDNGCVVE